MEIAMGIENEIAKQANNARTRVATVTAVLDTAIYAAGDVLFDTTLVSGIVPVAGSALELRSIEVLDEDDQGVALDIVFLDAAVTLGTFNNAPVITDANARAILGIVSVPAANFIDLGGCRVATVQNVGLSLQAAANGQDLYIAGITRGGTPTYTASGLKIKLGFY
jgi:hypothetical protein